MVKKEKRKDVKLATSETGLAAGIRSLAVGAAVAQPEVLADVPRGKAVMPGKDRERHQDIIQAGLLGHKHFEKALGRFDRDMTAKKRREQRLEKARLRREKKGKR